MDARAHIAVVVKGYPRLSETFIAQEILALEARGVSLEIWSLRRPTDRAVHPMHKRIAAPVTYLPEYLYQEPVRVLRGLLWSLRQPNVWPLTRAFWRDLRRDPTPSRLRRLGQAFVMAREMPESVETYPRALPAYARLGSPLRRAADGAQLDLLGTRQGHLDHAGLGKTGEARRRGVGRDLHRAGRGASERAGARTALRRACLSWPRPRPLPIPCGAADA